MRLWEGRGFFSSLNWRARCPQEKCVWSYWFILFMEAFKPLDCCDSQWPRGRLLLSIPTIPSSSLFSYAFFVFVLLWILRFLNSGCFCFIASHECFSFNRPSLWWHCHIPPVFPKSQMSDPISFKSLSPNVQTNFLILLCFHDIA